MASFTSVKVQPSYGNKRALVTWAVTSDIADGEFHVYRSPDGSGNWELLNVDPVTGTSYEDTTLVPGNLQDIPHYRVLCVKDDAEYDSPIIGIYNLLTRKEYAVCSKILKMEFLQLSRGEGLKVLVYKPLQSGEVSDQVDPDTLQHTGVPCPSLDHEDNSYDQIYKEGYARPVLTLMRITDNGPIVVMDRQNGLSTRDENMIQARFLGYPHITTGDMIVNYETDDRYAVTDTVKAYKFKGVFPVAFDAKLQMLSRKDVRYKVPVPTTIPKLTPREP